MTKIHDSQCTYFFDFKKAMLFFFSIHMSDLGFDNLFCEWVSDCMSCSITAKQGTISLPFSFIGNEYLFFSMLSVGCV